MIPDEMPAMDLADASADALIDLYRRVRRRTEVLAAPLSPEDQSAQSMPRRQPRPSGTGGIRPGSSRPSF